jgi:hypothetical protein
MPRTTLYDVNGSAGAWVSIPSTMPARRVEVMEDESDAPEGLQFKTPDDNFTSIKTVGAGTEPIILGNTVAHGNNKGALLGLPTQVNRAADTYIQLLSKTATATKVRVTEIE